VVRGGARVRAVAGAGRARMVCAGWAWRRDRVMMLGDGLRMIFRPWRWGAWGYSPREGEERVRKCTVGLVCDRGD
jgi:hypothetical protein